MKHIRKLITIGLLFLVFASCEKEKFPYPLEDVERGVAIDISRVSGTDGVLGAGVTAGNFKVKVQIPKQQGSYDHMKYAQLLCVYTNAAKQIKSVVVQDNITAFPSELTIDMAKACQLLGISAPALGDNMTFTVNVVLKNDLVIPGWTKEVGYNNTYFTGWEVDGRDFSYRVSYTAFCAFNQDIFNGDAICSEDGSNYPVTVTPLAANDLPQTLPVGVTAGDLVGLQITDIWDAGGVLKVWINKIDYSLIIPDQLVIPSWYQGTADFWFKNSAGASVSTCDNSLIFTVYAAVPSLGGGFGDISYVITLGAD